jgi:hypothetical protein
LTLTRRPAVYRYSAVLVMLGAVFTFAMIAPVGPWTPLVTAFLQGLAVIAALSRAKAARPLFYTAVASITVTLAMALAAGSGDRFLAGAFDFVSAGLILLVPIAIGIEFRRDLTVTLQSVLAAVCVYVVLGMFFASVGSGIGTLGRQPYFAGHNEANSADYMYFSFITMATVGYGDLVPAQRLGRVLAVLEGLSGQLYLVTVVAVLVTNLRLGGRAPE